jgi:DNA repair protein RadA/Sms
MRSVRQTESPGKQGKTAYVCQHCGGISPKWKGKCDDCGTWDTLVSETVSPKTGAVADRLSWETLDVSHEEVFPRLATGLAEFDRVCGGGIVKGSVTLVAGDPGIGKSTLLLQIASRLTEHTPVVYVSGEESASQIRLRAQRLGLAQSSIRLLSTCQLDGALSLVSQVLNPETIIPGFLIVDSIQTMTLPHVGTTPGTLNQVRECMTTLIALAKTSGLAVMIVGHITKEGAIAGPKALEHMVDTVLYFEGDNHRPYRLLRTIKNRFGATHEVGVFDMVPQGLKEVANPSSLFLSPRKHDIPGSCIFAGMEGSRPLMVEFQALSTPSFLASPRRAVVGWDSQRLSMILAVLEARCQVNFSKKDVFLTVLGGMRVTEPAADVCVALALLSCLKKKSLPRSAIAFGEIGLTGEIYPSAYTEYRLREAEQLGFRSVFMPDSPLKPTGPCTILHHVKDLELCFKNEPQ